MEIGGFFPYEKTAPEDNHYMERLCPDAGDVKHLMSGRCAIYLCLKDSMLTDKRKVAYLPSYTCETVTGCFVKAGYTIFYYDVDEHLVPLFDEKVLGKISFLLICGYYGFTTFDTGFVRRCREQGITVMQDLTHTAFSAADVSRDTDYLAVSLRKWMGVTSGGIAIKREGKFSAEPVKADQEHLEIRHRALTLRQEYEKTGDEGLKKASYDAFWEAEWMLREIFDMQEGNVESLKHIRHYPLDEAIHKRRENYQWLLGHLPKSKKFIPVFPELTAGACPMFFAFLCEDREPLMEYLAQRQIAPKVYWPVPPFIKIEEYKGASHIYEKIMSISCDQRYTTTDMQKIADAFAAYA